MNNSLLRVFGVSFLVCLTCSAMVSTAAVLLKERQEANQELDKRKNILSAAGLIEPGEAPSPEAINELYSSIRAQVVDFETGSKVSDLEPSTFNQQKASKDPSMSLGLERKEDLAGIKRRENKGLLYEVFGDDGNVETIIIPIRGYGLWSTLYGFLALEKDGQTVKGITYYAHGETPGLGGEVDNPNWKSLWKQKKLYDSEWNVALKVVKGPAKTDDPHGIDGLSGATITSVGVSRMIEYWLGDSAYGRYLKTKVIVKDSDDQSKVKAN